MTVTGRTAVYAVTGDPIAHSLSPLLHNAWIAEAGLDAVYVALRVQKPEAFAHLAALGLAGANVTAPWKEAAAQACARLDACTGALQAANTLTVEPDGSLSGFNTDVSGFLTGLDEAQPGWRERTGGAVVLGAGGAARAVIAGLREAGVARIAVVNRDQTKAQAASAFPGGAAMSWDQASDAVAEADLIVQTASGGAQSAAVALLAYARPGAIACDIVYTPRMTPFLQAAADRGLHAVDGLYMLAHQAAAAFEIWFGARPDPAAGRVRLLQALGETP